MNQDLFELGSGPAFERLKKLSHRAEKLPPESRELVDELVEAYTVSVEELQVAAEELNQQNAELVAAHEEIELQRSRYRDMFEFAPDGYLVTDIEGLIHEVNRAAVSLLGVSRQYLMGKPLVLYVHSEEQERFHRQLDRLTRSRGADANKTEWEMRIHPRQGPDFPAALTVAPILDVKGELTGLRWLVRDISESKRAEERERLLTQVREQNAAALEANRLLHALIETMPVGAMIADANGMILLLNTTGREILGANISGHMEAPERPYTPYRPDGTPFPQEEMPLVLAVNEGQIVRDVEMLIQRADGENRSILTSAAPIKDENDEIVSGIAVFQDVTERKRSRLALRQYAERLEVLRQADQVILAAGSLDELIYSVLPFTRELVPCQLVNTMSFDSEAKEFSLLGLISNGDIELDESFQSVPLEESWPLEELNQGKIVTFNIESILGSQEKLTEKLQKLGVHYVASVPLVAQGELLGLLNLGCEDAIELEANQREILTQMAGELAIGMRQLRQREQLQSYATDLERKVHLRTGALRQSEERFRIILEAAVFGIALLDTKGRIVQSNPALQTMTGYSESELQGASFSDYSHPEDAEADEELRQALASLETGHYQTKKRYVRKDGQVRWSELTVSRVKPSGGKKTWLAVAVMEDITEKRRIQETLARAERLTLAGRLGASLAHEINNPVQAVIGCLGLAEEMLEEDNNDVRRYLDIAMEELERTADIVTQLRDLGREAELGQKKPTDLNEFVEKILLLTRKRSQNQGVDVDWQPAEELPSVRLSPEGMQQVLLNIILNALNAMEEKEDGRKLVISTGSTDQPEGISVTVRDTGVGIEADMLEHIFEPFHSSRSEGLGLGLFISRNIVEEHGGRIDVESVPGDGATFTVWLPI